tara:strand:+ start:771 stop:1061 length:291 start_codon:yes stop_codon:yes gene_type:complete
MNVSIDLCLIPIGVGISISPYLVKCRKVIEQSGLDFEVGPNGTSIEGDWEQVFSCVRSCHEVLHENGVQRIYASIKVNTRIDRKSSFRDKVKRLNS